jgi:hypothetical protein
MTEDNQTPDESVKANEEAETVTESDAPEATANADAAEVETATAKQEPAPAPKKAQAPPTGAQETFVYWPVEKDHGSVSRMLTRKGDAVDMSVERAGMGKAFMNLILLVLIFGVTGAGVVQYQYEASDKTLERKRLKRQALEEGHLRLQQKKQKSYGILRVESTPDRAAVRLQISDHSGNTSDIDLNKGDKPASATDAALAAANEAKGMKQSKLTPMNIMNLDISKVYTITVEREGYLTDSFVVGGKHIWTKDGGSGEYKFVKNVEMFAAPCEYWFLYDAEKREEVQFPLNGPCEKHYADATKRQIAVTECTCKMAVPGAEGADEEGKKDGAPGKVKVVPAK